MFFWRKKKNQAEQDREVQDDRLLHRPTEPALEPVLDADTDLPSEFIKHELDPTAQEVIEDLVDIPGLAHRDEVVVASDMGGGWLSRLTAGLSKSSSKLSTSLGDIFLRRKADESTLQDLEDVLIEADLGPHTAAKLVERLRARKFDKDQGAGVVQNALAEDIEGILSAVTRPLSFDKPAEGPRTILVCGVNGVGKTTTIGKLVYHIHYKLHKKVMMAAGDTFRAAAIEQLQVWADRTKCPLIKSEIGADSAALAFQAYEKAVTDHVDVLMIDTAGRLHNKANLMAELEKMIRVLKKKSPDVPHDVILVLDATTGQNAIAQVETFKQLVGVTGLVVTKLDGSAKGGIVVALADKFGLPIFAVGVGEDIEDLQSFHPREFARTLVRLEV